MSTEREAGRDLDIEIGRALFGIKKIHYADYDTADRRWPLFIPSGKPWRTHSIDARPVPEFSTSIADAWRIVEKMRAGDDGYDFELTFENGIWECWFPHMAYDAGHAFADTAPLAICLAVLSAIEARTEGGEG